ncbi:MULTISPECIES: DUF2442 domain-containing protein [unclassified Microbacterium]|uniref:DUF2442 domain-containing protein n=1 Tax=unclassified Microbacterium TaxID=2609290 RepID=UPI00343ECB34
MSTSVDDAHVVDLTTDDLQLHVRIDDGRTLSVPLTWFPRLAAASAAERSEWTLIGAGEGIHWPRLDEDISIAALLRGR